MYIRLDEFMQEANSRIERTLIEKLRLLGYTKEDILGDVPNKPTMKKYLLEQRHNFVHEEYTVNGIRLFEVTWTPGEVTIIDAAV